MTPLSDSHGLNQRFIIRLYPAFPYLGHDPLCKRHDPVDVIE